jgi:hypothetical protein
MIPTGEYRSTGRKVSTVRLIWSYLGSNPCFRGERPAINRLCQLTLIIFKDLVCKLLHRSRRFTLKIDSDVRDGLSTQLITKVETAKIGSDVRDGLSTPVNHKRGDR